MSRLHKATKIKVVVGAVHKFHAWLRQTIITESEKIFGLEVMRRGQTLIIQVDHVQSIQMPVQPELLPVVKRNMDMDMGWTAKVFKFTVIPRSVR